MSTRASTTKMGPTTRTPDSKICFAASITASTTPRPAPILDSLQFQVRMGKWLPNETMSTERQNACRGESTIERRVEGSPFSGLAQTPLARMNTEFKSAYSAAGRLYVSIFIRTRDVSDQMGQCTSPKNPRQRGVSVRRKFSLS